MKKLCMVFVLVSLSLAICQAGEAADWILTGTSEDGNTSLYVDKEGVTTDSQGVATAWTKFLFGNPESFESKEFSQMLVRMEYACGGNKTRMTGLIFNYADGSQEIFDVVKEWHPVKPGTLESESYQYLCK